MFLSIVNLFPFPITRFIQSIKEGTWEIKKIATMHHTWYPLFTATVQRKRYIEGTGEESPLIVINVDKNISDSHLLFIMRVEWHNIPNDLIYCLHRANSRETCSSSWNHPPLGIASCTNLLPIKMAYNEGKIVRLLGTPVVRITTRNQTTQE
jgi:hypothetical protein